MSDLASSANPEVLRAGMGVRSSDQDRSAERGGAKRPVHRIREFYRVLPATSISHRAACSANG